MKWQRKLTFEQRDEIMELYLQGYSLTKIAEKFNIDHSSVSYYCKELKHLRKYKQLNKTEIGNNPTEISKELKEHREENKIKINSRYISALPKKGMMYADYLKIKNEREAKKLYEEKHK